MVLLERGNIKDPYVINSILTAYQILVGYRRLLAQMAQFRDRDGKSHVPVILPAAIRF